jgi:hypothetical protein
LKHIDSTARAIYRRIANVPDRRLQLTARLATLDVEGWTLLDGEESAKKSPDTFWIPPLEERQALKKGNLVKLMFKFEDGVERMWVVVEGHEGPFYCGKLDNGPISSQLECGDAVLFEARHVINIWED